ncbi:MAG: ROK family protein [Actinomycetota bacterium]|nr:ROK family protein [Actinomycetota bacterium]
MTSSEVVGALDIGGTHVSGGRVHVDSASLEAGSRVFERLPGAAGHDELVAAITRVTRAIAHPDLTSLGVSVPGPFDYARGVSEITHKLEALHGVDLRSQLQDASALEAIHFVNDAEAFLLGEWWVGAARGHGRAIGITLGTGLGSAFSENGEMVRSRASVPPRGELYAVEFRGAPVERTISRAALLRAYGASDDGVDVEQIADRARAGEPAARRVFTELGTALGEFLTPWLRAFGPSCLVVGGSISRSWDLFADTLRAELQSLPELDLVTAAAQREDAALLGAAYYAAKRQ